MSNIGPDGRSRLGGWAYKKCAKEKSEKHEQLLAKNAKIDSWIIKQNATVQDFIIQSDKSMNSQEVSVANKIGVLTSSVSCFSEGTGNTKYCQL